MTTELYDVWAVAKSDDSNRFRVEYGLSAEGVDNALRKLRRIYLPEHYSLIRKPHYPSDSAWEL